MKNKIVMKIAAVLAAGVLAFSLTACTNTTDDTQTETTDVVTDETAENTDAENTDAEKTEAENTEDANKDATDSEGATGADGSEEAVAQSITVEVKNAEGEVTTYTATTESEFLLGALDDIEELTYDGYESDWGYYLTTLNDITADYDADGAYWSLYVNGEYGSNGVSTQPVEEGAVYSFVYEVYVAE